MEESEKRRERLKAMRMEATQVGVNNAPEMPFGGLSNPLIESEFNSVTPLQHNPARFDYYTDPMAAFSGNRRSNISSHVSQRHYDIQPRTAYQGRAPSPVQQNPAFNSLGQRTFQAPPTFFNQGPPRNPMEAAGPFGRAQANPPRPWGGSGGNFNPPPNMYRGNNFSSPSFGRGDSPSSYGRGTTPPDLHHTPPNFYNTPPNLYRGNNFISPRFGQGDSPATYSRGKGSRYNHYGSGDGVNQFPDSGRGRGQAMGGSMSSGPRPSGRRGKRDASSHKSISAELHPELYYYKEMVEDPWKSLTPVILKGNWKGNDPVNSLRLPKSIPEPTVNSLRLPKSIPEPIGMKQARLRARASRIAQGLSSLGASKFEGFKILGDSPDMKRAKVAVESSEASVPRGSSLAEYLATSFNESIDEPVNEEPGN